MENLHRLSLDEEKKKKLFFILMLLLRKGNVNWAVSSFDDILRVAMDSLELRERFSPVLHVHSLQKGGANHFFQVADDSSLERVTRFDRKTFSYLLHYFQPLWNETSIVTGSSARAHRRCLTSDATLGICLFFLAYCPPFTDICLFAGVSQASISRYLSFSLKILLSILRLIPAGQVACPPESHLTQLSEQVAAIYHEVMRGCVIVTDGSLHKLEADNLAKNNFWFEEWHIDYNGHVDSLSLSKINCPARWKSLYCKKGLYFFLLDGTIVWYVIDAPGSLGILGHFSDFPFHFIFFQRRWSYF